MLFLVGISLSNQIGDKQISFQRSHGGLTRVLSIIDGLLHDRLSSADVDVNDFIAFDQFKCFQLPFRLASDTICSR